ncbi:MAG: hypothetical protein QW666_02380 [Candidatus Woesearchaeota archaeon]
MEKELMFVAFIGIVSLLVMMEFAGTGAAVAGAVRLQGSIMDSEGKPVLSSRYNYWQSAEGTVRVIPGKFNQIVAESNGVILGEGKMDQISYSLQMHQDWEQADVLNIFVGFYDPWRPETNKLVPCTRITKSEINRHPRMGQQYVLVMDLKCNEMTALEKMSSVGYR